MLPSTLLALYTRHKKNLGDVSSTLFIDWCDKINRNYYRRAIGVDPKRFITSSTISVTSATATYAQPTDFLNIQTKDTGIYIVNNGVDTDNKLAETGFGSSSVGYYLSSGNIVFTPAPTTSQTYRLRYIPTITAITALSTVMVIPDEYIEYAKDAIDVLYDIWDEDASAEGMADQRFTRAIDELCSNLRRDTGAVGIETYSGSFA